jgi:hypothetical protein
MEMEGVPSSKLKSRSSSLRVHNNYELVGET